MRGVIMEGSKGCAGASMRCHEGSRGHQMGEN